MKVTAYEINLDKDDEEQYLFLYETADTTIEQRAYYKEFARFVSLGWNKITTVKKTVYDRLVKDIKNLQLKKSIKFPAGFQIRVFEAKSEEINIAEKVSVAKEAC